MTDSEKPAVKMDKFMDSMPEREVDPEMEPRVAILVTTDDPERLQAHLEIIGHSLSRIAGEFLLYENVAFIIETTKHLAPSIVMIIKADGLASHFEIQEDDDEQN